MKGIIDLDKRYRRLVIEKLVLMNFNMYSSLCDINNLLTNHKNLFAIDESVLKILKAIDTQKTNLIIPLWKKLMNLIFQIIRNHFSNQELISILTKYLTELLPLTILSQIYRKFKLFYWF